jgi:hypothetical protein
MATLMILVLWQFRTLQTEGGELERLRGEQTRAEREIGDYEARLKPLADLGLLEMPHRHPVRRKASDTGTVGSDSAR